MQPDWKMQEPPDNGGYYRIVNTGIAFRLEPF